MKRAWKRYLSLLMALVMLLSLMPVGAGAEDESEAPAENAEPAEITEQLAGEEFFDGELVDIMLIPEVQTDTEPGDEPDSAEEPVPTEGPLEEPVPEEEEESEKDREAEPTATASDNCLTFSSLSAFTINLPKHWDGKLFYSTDAAAWNEWDGSNISAAQNAADGKYCLYLCGTGNGTISSRFVISGDNVACTGSIETLLDYETAAAGNHPTMRSYCFLDLFNACTALISGSALPAMTLAEGCYSSMFSGCTSLTSAPALPATTLAYACYDNMFRGCISLTNAPVLPAATLAYGCYYGMFSDCTSLKSVPELPATTLAEGCYCGMFSDCTGINLSEADSGEPWSIPAEANPAESWNAGMFSGTGGSFTGDPEIGKVYYQTEPSSAPTPQTV